MPKFVFLIGLAVLTSACTTQDEQWTYPEPQGTNDPSIPPDPPCSVNGYFASNTPGKYYHCIYNTAHGRWLKTIFTCPNGKIFNNATQKCE
ncbi:chitin binding peritrophin-A domain-containing protein [Pseudomonas sp. W4I3]|uniref:chitin binding peritrophin-A domain-containing protein n=1 Tax=Pseudomonas sp. W4I3 TaxID=3042294 RepID=UPI00358DEEED